MLDITTSRRPSSARSMIRLAGVAGVVAMALAVTACSASASIGGSSIDEAELEEQVATQLAATVGDAEITPIIDCPGDLDAEVDATTTCDLTVEGDDTVYRANVVVTAVNDGVASFSVAVEE